MSVAVLMGLAPLPALCAADTETVARDANLIAAAPLSESGTDAPILLAQANCASCGAEIGVDAVLGETVSTGKKKKELLMTDSLWGNLILDMAYQRDGGLQKLAKRMGIVNLATMTSISGIAAGTLAQGVVALGTLNPPAGHEDSYVPGGIGVALSAATILTFVARTYFGHEIQKAVHDRQLAIKHKVEALLAHMERANGNCADAEKQMTDLIGARATKEWLQLWRSSHQLALTTPTPTAFKPTGEAAGPLAKMANSVENSCTSDSLKADSGPKHRTNSLSELPFEKISYAEKQVSATTSDLVPAEESLK